MRMGKSGPRSNFLPSLSMASVVKISSKTILEEVDAMADGLKKSPVASGRALVANAGSPDDDIGVAIDRCVMSIFSGFPKYIITLRLGLHHSEPRLSSLLPYTQQQQQTATASPCLALQSNIQPW